MLVDIAPVWTQPDAASTSTATASSVGGSWELQRRYKNAIIGDYWRTRRLIFFGLYT